MKFKVKLLGVVTALIALSGTTKGAFAEEGTFESVGSILQVTRAC